MTLQTTVVIVYRSSTTYRLDDASPLLFVCIWGMKSHSNGRWKKRPRRGDVSLLSSPRRWNLKKSSPRSHRPPVDHYSCWKIRSNASGNSVSYSSGWLPDRLMATWPSNGWLLIWMATWPIIVFRVFRRQPQPLVQNKRDFWELTNNTYGAHKQKISQVVQNKRMELTNKRYHKSWLKLQSGCFLDIFQLWYCCLIRLQVVPKIKQWPAPTAARPLRKY